jgi:PAS domain S-box-containing protein
MDTDHTKIAEALRDQKKLIDWIFNSNIGLIALCDMEGNYTLVGKSHELLGYDSDFLIGKNVMEFVHPEDADYVSKEFTLFLTTGEKRKVEYRYKRNDGEYLWFETIGTILCNEKGNPEQILFNTSDITERKKTEETLRKSEEMMRSIYRVAPTGIGVVLDRLLIEVNPRICEMTGYTREELLGINARILYPSQEEYEFVGKEKYDQIRKIGSGKVETFWQKKDGSIINVLLASTPIDLTDHSKGITFTALDITDRKLAENEILKLNEDLEQRVIDRTAQLEATNKELEAFSYSVSHDLRAPLRHINGYIELLNEDFRSDLPEKAQYYLTNITNAAKQMGTLIDELLRFSRTGRQELQKINIEMNVIAKEALESVKQHIEKRTITWKVQELPQVNGDYFMLKHESGGRGC